MADAGPSEINVRVSEPSSSVGPAFLNFASVRPSAKTPWTVYTRHAGSSTEIIDQHTIIAGETEDVEFFSTNRDRIGSTEGRDCRYLPAVYNPETGSLDVYGSTPLYLINHRTKRLRDVNLDSGASLAADYKARRNDLGEVFGTKKAKSQIKAEERNRVDITAMEGIKGHLMDSIVEREEEPELALPPDVIPQPNTTTDQPMAVYPKESLLSDAEWSSIDAGALIKAKDDKSRSALLPWRRSRHVEGKMRMIIGSSASSNVKKTVVRTAYYLSTLIALYNMAPQVSKLSKPEIGQKLHGVPSQLLNGVLERFTETSGKKFNVTGKMKKKLLAWICVLYLHLDEYSTEIAKVASDLKLKPTEVQDMFRSLGCKVDLMSTAEREKLGLTMADAKAGRRAVLRAPVVFPKQRTRAPARR